MKTVTVFAAILIAIIAYSPLNSQEIYSNETKFEKEISKARGFIQLLQKGDNEKAAESFDETMKQKLPFGQLSAIWPSLTAQFGNYNGIKESTAEVVSGYVVTRSTLEFEKSKLTAMIAFNDKLEISGLFFSPYKDKSDFIQPPYADTSLFNSRKIEFGLENWKLPGILTIPKGEGPFPAVVLVHGSGPNDMDETIGKNKPFRDLAWGLASNGIAVLRYDKRTYKYPNECAAAEPFTVKEETIDDAVEAVKFLSGKDLINPKRIFVLGHSLGATVIPRIAKLDNISAGYILLAALARPLGETIWAQCNYIFNIDGDLTKEEQKKLDDMQAKIDNLEKLDTNANIPADSLPMNVPAAYWLDLRKHPLIGEITEVNRPMLILQGVRDYQVTTEDFYMIKTALSEKSENKQVDFKIYPSLNHLFIEGSSISTPDEYNTAGNVSGEVIIDISNWIKSFK